MPIFSLFRLVIRLFVTAGDLKNQYKEESERFDEKHKISAPQSKMASHLMVGLKIIAISLLMGDFEFLGNFSPSKYFTLSALIFVGIIVFLYIILIMYPCEKQSERDDAISNDYRKFMDNERCKISVRRKHRKNSNFIDDLGF